MLINELIYIFKRFILTYKKVSYVALERQRTEIWGSRVSQASAVPA
jgi:hypothetical protein